MQVNFGKKMIKIFLILIIFQLSAFACSASETQLVQIESNLSVNCSLPDNKLECIRNCMQNELKGNKNDEKYTSYYVLTRENITEIKIDMY